MKKKLFVLLVILAVVLTGVFADGVDQNGAVEVILKGVIGPVFEHGVLEDDELSDSAEITNALAASGASFTYAYTSNQTLEGAKLYMDFTDFETIGGDHTIRIASILVGGSAPTIDENGALIFNSINNSEGGFTSKSIKITAVQNAGESVVGGGTVGANESVAEAEDGTYFATLTFSVKAV